MSFTNDYIRSKELTVNERKEFVEWYMENKFKNEPKRKRVQNLPPGERFIFLLTDHNIQNFYRHKLNSKKRIKGKISRRIGKKEHIIVSTKELNMFMEIVLFHQSSFDDLNEENIFGILKEEIAFTTKYREYNEKGVKIQFEEELDDIIRRFITNINWVEVNVWKEDVEKHECIGKKIGF